MRFTLSLISLVHGLIKLLLAAALIAGGVLLFMFPVGELFELLDTREIQDASLYRRMGGVALAIAAFLALLPRLPARRRAREVSFSSAHGEVTIQLDHVESMLERVVAKLPEVKSIALYIKPLEGRGRVQVVASTILVKDPEAEATDVTARVNGYIQLHTRKLLGLQEVEVRLRVRRFLMKLKSLKPEPLMLEAPRREQPKDSPDAPPPSQPEAGDPESDPEPPD